MCVCVSLCARNMNVYCRTSLHVLLLLMSLQSEGNKTQRPPEHPLNFFKELSVCTTTWLNKKKCDEEPNVTIWRLLTQRIRPWQQKPSFNTAIPNLNTGHNPQQTQAPTPPPSTLRPKTKDCHMQRVRFTCPQFAVHKHRPLGKAVRVVAEERDSLSTVNVHADAGAHPAS